MNQTEKKSGKTEGKGLGVKRLMISKFVRLSPSFGHHNLSYLLPKSYCYLLL